MKIPIAYIELPSNDVAASKEFYGSLFGWEFQDWGPDYASFTEAGVAGGLTAVGIIARRHHSSFSKAATSRPRWQK